MHSPSPGAIGPLNFAISILDSTPRQSDRVICVVVRAVPRARCACYPICVTSKLPPIRRTPGPQSDHICDISPARWKRSPRATLSRLFGHRVHNLRESSRFHQLDVSLCYGAPFACPLLCHLSFPLAGKALSIQCCPTTLAAKCAHGRCLPQQEVHGTHSRISVSRALYKQTTIWDSPDLGRYIDAI